MLVDPLAVWVSESKASSGLKNVLGLEDAQHIWSRVLQVRGFQTLQPLFEATVV